MLMNGNANGYAYGKAHTNTFAALLNLTAGCAQIFAAQILWRRFVCRSVGRRRRVEACGADLSCKLAKIFFSSGKRSFLDFDIYSVVSSQSVKNNVKTI